MSFADATSDPSAGGGGGGGGGGSAPADASTTAAAAAVSAAASLPPVELYFDGVLISRLKSERKPPFELPARFDLKEIELRTSWKSAAPMHLPYFHFACGGTTDRERMEYVKFFQYLAHTVPARARVARIALPKSTGGAVLWLYGPNTELHKQFTWQTRVRCCYQAKKGTSNINAAATSAADASSVHDSDSGSGSGSDSDSGPNDGAVGSNGKSTGAANPNGPRSFPTRAELESKQPRSSILKKANTGGSSPHRDSPELLPSTSSASVPLFDGLAMNLSADPSAPTFLPPPGSAAAAAAITSQRRTTAAPSAAAAASSAAAAPAIAVAQIHPSLLETVTHMHNWAFGALAELIDNSYDAGAKHITIDYEDMTDPVAAQAAKTAAATAALAGRAVDKKSAADAAAAAAERKLHHVLSISDDGIGMTHSELVRMLNFGHAPTSDPTQSRIGRFGVGFKQGAMRLGEDALVFTKGLDTYSLGFLSRTMHANKQILTIPVATWLTKSIVVDSRVCTPAQEQACLAAVTQHSPFRTQMRIAAEFAKIKTPTGTRILIYNLKNGKYDLNFTIAANDIQIESHRDTPRSRPSQQAHDVPADYSLVAYLSSLYLHPPFTLAVCKRTVPPVNWTQRLGGLRAEFADNTKNYRCTFGFNEQEEGRGNCGLHLYWRRRLIETYYRVGMQNMSGEGIGVIGFIDLGPVEGIVPVNNKLAFNDHPAFNDAIKWLADTLEVYFYNKIRPDDTRVEAPKRAVEDVWVQCDTCKKWRLLPKGAPVPPEDKPFFCWQNPDVKHKECSVPEQDTSAHLTVAVSTQQKLATAATAAATKTTAAAATKPKPAATAAAAAAPAPAAAAKPKAAAAAKPKAKAAAAPAASTAKRKAKPAGSSGSDNDFVGVDSNADDSSDSGASDEDSGDGGWGSDSGKKKKKKRDKKDKKKKKDSKKRRLDSGDSDKSKSKSDKSERRAKRKAKKAAKAAAAEAAAESKSAKPTTATATAAAAAAAKSNPSNTTSSTPTPSAATSTASGSTPKADAKSKSNPFAVSDSSDSDGDSVPFVERLVQRRLVTPRGAAVVAVEAAKAAAAAASAASAAAATTAPTPDSPTPKSTKSKRRVAISLSEDDTAGSPSNGKHTADADADADADTSATAAATDEPEPAQAAAMDDEPAAAEEEEPAPAEEADDAAAEEPPSAPSDSRPLKLTLKRPTPAATAPIPTTAAVTPAAAPEVVVKMEKT